MCTTKIVQVAVAVIYDAHGNMLISKRAADVHMGGLWEFPGGKVEAGEDIETALRREIYEELGIDIECSSPLISIPFDYGDKRVHLQVRKVIAYNGQAYGREGQQIRWIAMEDSHRYHFPAANRYIIPALQLPRLYYITPEPDTDMRQYLAQLQTVIDKGASLIQFRSKRLNKKDFACYARESIQLCRANKVKMLLNTDPATALELDADGLHLSSANLLACDQRPIAADCLLAASCHNEKELDKAQQLETDFAVLGPVAKTVSHPDVEPMGWKVFASLLTQMRMPVFALGGLSDSDMSVAQESGAQGIAAIRSLWQ